MSGSLASSVQRALLFSETGVMQFKDSNQVVLEARNEVDFYAPEDLWSHFRSVELCSEFLDSTQLPLETPSAQKLKLSTTVKSPRGVISPRRGAVTKRDKKQKKQLRRKKSVDNGSIEIFLSKYDVYEYKRKPLTTFYRPGQEKSTRKPLTLVFYSPLVVVVRLQVQKNP